MSLALAPDPAPVAAPRTWTDAAECRHYPYDLWVDGSSPARTRAARAVCAVCPVNDRCLLEALTLETGAGDRHRYRIWGGLTGRQRRRIGTPWPSLVRSAAAQVRRVVGA